LGLKVIEDREIVTEANNLIKLLDLPPVTLLWNNRLRTTGGLFRHRSKVCSIELNPKYLLNFGMEVTLGILRHEMAHYALFKRNKNHQHTPEFKELCLKLGGLMNSAMAGKRFKVCASDKFLHPAPKFTYTCPGCGLQIKMTRARNKKARRWKHGACITCHTPSRRFTEEKAN
jgi:predicted SprT family Zn-dependent metalloprotease